MSTTVRTITDDIEEVRDLWLQNPTSAAVFERMFNLLAVEYKEETGQWPCLFCGEDYTDEEKSCGCSSLTTD